MFLVDQCSVQCYTQDWRDVDHLETQLAESSIFIVTGAGVVEVEAHEMVFAVLGLGFQWRYYAAIRTMPDERLYSSEVCGRVPNHMSSALYSRSCRGRTVSELTPTHA